MIEFIILNSNNNYLFYLKLMFGIIQFKKKKEKFFKKIFFIENF